MGDVAMTVPVLAALAQQNPNLKITIVSRPFFKAFFDGIPNTSFFAFDENKRHKGIFGFWHLYQDLKKLEIDAFADLHNVLRSKFVRKLFILSGKKIAYINKRRDEKAALTREENKIFKPLTTVFEIHAKVFEQLGFAIDFSHPKFPEKAVLNPKILELIGSTQTHLIGIAPFAQYQTKVYPLDLMQKVIDDLAKNNQYKMLLFGGGKKEITKLETLAKNKQNVIVVAGKLTFKEELELISNLDLMLAMDSGNAHIAAMLGKKVITLWGATHPFSGFLPFNQPLENALVSDRNLYPKLPTSVYGNKKVKGYKNAMRTILPEDVVCKIKRIIS